MSDSRVSSHRGEGQRRGEPPASRESWAVELAPDPVREWAYRRVLCREAYARGYAAAWEAGRRALLEELAAAQREACPAPGVLASPEYAELDERRYGPGGRGHAADWHPGDYAGGDVVW